MKETFVVCNSISKEYVVGKEKVVALNNVTLEIESNDIVAITGPSGSGKSTLLNIIGGLDSPTSGTLSVNGRRITELTDDELAIYRNQTVGFIFQQFHLQEFLTVRQNIEIPLLFSKVGSKRRSLLIDEVIERLGLKNRANHLPSQLSGGQMQRVAIARALLNKPKLILADEPTGNLDKENGREVMELLTALNREHGTTVVIVTHNAEIAEKCNRVIKFSDGALQ